MKDLKEKLAEWGMGEASIQMLIDYSLKVVGALLVLYIGFLIGGKLQQAVTRRLEKKDFDASLTKFFGSLIRWGIILMSFLACLSVFGVETTSFAAVIGGASVAIGLAMQGSLSHVASGIMLLIFRPFKVGDVVKLGGDVGGVSEISLFTVTLDTPDKRRILIPNGKVFGSTIENVTFHPIRRVDVNVGVDYSADIDATRKVIQEAIASVELGIKGDDEYASAAVLVDLGDSSVNWQARVFCKTEDYWGAKEALTRAIKMKLDEAGIDIPFPQMVVHNTAE